MAPAEKGIFQRKEGLASVMADAGKTLTVLPFGYKDAPTAHSQNSIFLLTCISGSGKVLGSINLSLLDSPLLGGRQALQGNWSLSANPRGDQKGIFYFINTKKSSPSAAKVNEFVYLAWKSELIKMNQNPSEHERPERMGHVVWNWHFGPQQKPPERWAHPGNLLALSRNFRLSH